MAWKRTIRFGLIVVVLSVVMNVVVAWTTAMVINADTLPAEVVFFEHEYPEYSDRSSGSMLSTWVVTTRRGFATAQVYAIAVSFGDVVPESLELSYADPNAGLPGWADPYIKVFDSGMTHCIGRGWPFVALVSDQVRIPPGPMAGPRIAASSVPLKEAKTGWVLESLPWSSGRPRVLPTRVIWGGFLANSALYAVALCLPFILRRVIRRRRGHCIVCGYDLRGDFMHGCPECGWRRPARRGEIARGETATSHGSCPEG